MNRTGGEAMCARAHAADGRFRETRVAAAGCQHAGTLGCVYGYGYGYTVTGNGYGTLG